ncbi:hypothetical protein [uncultured Tateyamaria sp.]|uniref:hypothetical protein n=1 Tax=uncultured Tateyamaria sp. TaxID=455651 RepID=UPI00261DD585|nr:hypothetical protein [uncultured Tateyamaria sp.]
MTAPVQDTTRILIGASSFADAAVALRLIERVMHDLRPRLSGMLVDETASLTVGAMATQRVISASGQVVLAPSPAQFNTLINADERAFRTALERLAHSVDASWTFQRDTGDLVERGLDSCAAVDILVFGHRSFHPVAGKIVTLTSSATSDGAALSTARLLARHLKADLVEMVIDDRIADGAVPQTRFATLDAAFGRLARINAQAVFVDLANGPALSPEQLRHLLDVARCPVFVLGLASAARALEHSTHIPASPDGGTH